MGLLSGLLMVPLVAALLLSFIPEQYGKAIKAGSLLFSGVAFLVSLAVYAAFDPNTYHFQLVESVPWMPRFGIQYKVGIDGISLWLVLLSTFLGVVASWFSFYIQDRPKTYFVLLHVLQVAMLGVFLSLDMILFYVFFEASLVPMALMIYIWGGSQRKMAGTKFFIYTFLASVFLLVGMIMMGLQMQKVTGQMSFDMVAIQANVASGALWTGAMQLQAILFWMFAIAFLVKCPIFPLHTWLPDAHTEAPTAGSVILAGVLLKMGTYAFLRLCIPLFPEAMQANVPWLIGLSVIGIVYGAVVAAVQPDIKRLVAYSSVAHMGFVMLGICSLSQTGMVGGAYQQLNHGVSTGALFLLIGLLYERIHTRMFADMGGLKAQMPIFSALFLIVMFSSVGLPGTNGFIGEFLGLMGAFEAASAGAFGLQMWVIWVAATGVVFAAVYLLIMFMKAFYGPVTNPNLLRLKDLKGHEIGLVGMFIVLIFVGGIYSPFFTKPMEASIGAARMMAVNPVGQRPMWSDNTMEIDRAGNLVRVTNRRPAEPGTYEVVDVIKEAGFYFEGMRKETVAAR